MRLQGRVCKKKGKKIMLQSNKRYRVATLLKQISKNGRNLTNGRILYKIFLEF